jgi:hypothetical protein
MSLLARTTLTYLIMFAIFSVLIPIVHIFVSSWLLSGLIAGLGVRFFRVYLRQRRSARL